jgi:FKBP-type peptidyl-prolyl cis-trans isomerase FklB
MKKISIVSVFLLLFCLGFMSCEGNKEPKNVALKTSIDSLSYAIGIQNGDQIKISFPERRGLELDHMNDFVNGFLDEMYSTKKTDKNYDLGRQLAADLKVSMDGPLLPTDSTSRVNKDAFVDAIVMVLLDKADGKMTVDEARTYIQEFVDKTEREANAGAIEAEQKFLAENKLIEGVIETPSGLQYKIINAGNGEIPGENMTVKVHYTGTLIDGTKFDSSLDRNEPFEFNTSGGVIPGWLEASKMMPVGSKWIIYVPSELGYGSRDMGTIPPFSTLIFEVEMLDVVK